MQSFVQSQDLSEKKVTQAPQDPNKKNGNLMDSLRKGGHQKMENRKGPANSMGKMNTLTRKLDLSPEEVKSFTPVFTEYSDEMSKLKQTDPLSRKNVDSLSTKELEKLITQRMDSKKKEYEINKKYDKKFKEILPLKKVYQLYLAEDQLESRGGGRNAERPQRPQGKDPMDRSQGKSQMDRSQGKNPMDKKDHPNRAPMNKNKPNENPPQKK